MDAAGDWTGFHRWEMYCFLSLTVPDAPPRSWLRGGGGGGEEESGAGRGSGEVEEHTSRRNTRA